MKNYNPVKMHKAFNITSVCRDDVVEAKSYEFAESLTDDEMNKIAETICDGMMDGFWTDLDIAIEQIEETRKETK